jgi:hypothetical protein
VCVWCCGKMLSLLWGSFVIDVAGGWVGGHMFGARLSVCKKIVVDKENVVAVVAALGPPHLLGDLIW